MHFNKNIYSEPQTKNLSKGKELTLTVIVALLILLWVYTATSKLADFQEFKRELNNQTFSRNTALLLLWLIPISEIIAATMLLFKKTRFIALLLSAALMLAFTGYIALVLLNYYDRTPCSCGGVLKELGWNAHFYFNLFFLTLSLIGIYLQHLNSKIQLNKELT